MLRALRAPFPVAFALCLCALLARSAPRLAHPHVWAEDGSLFLREALEHGAAPLFVPYAGYLHVMPRALAALFVQLPLSWFALAVTLTTLVAYAAAASLFARRCHAHLVPQDGVRVLTSVALCFAPGLWEVTGNLANLHSVALLAATFVALQALERPLGVAELVLLALVGSTAGELVLLAPAFAFRAWLRWREGGGRWQVAGELAAVALILGWALVNTLLFREAASTLPPTEPARVDEVVRSSVSTFTARYLVHPVLGDSLTRSFFRRPTLVQGLVALALLGGLVLGLRRVPARGRSLLMVTAACVAGLVVLTWVVRPWSVREEPFGPVLSLDVFRGRYWFSCAPAAVLLWVTAAAAVHPRLALGLCGALIALSAPRWALGPFGPEQDWAGSARRIEQVRARPGAVERIPINPEGWTLTVHGPP